MDELPPTDWDATHEELRRLVETYFAADPESRAYALSSLSEVVERRKKLTRLSKN